MSEGGEEGAAEQGVVPIEDDAGLVVLWLLLRGDPNFIVSQLGEELAADILSAALRYSGGVLRGGLLIASIRR